MNIFEEMDTVLSDSALFWSVSQSTLYYAVSVRALGPQLKHSDEGIFQCMWFLRSRKS